MITVFPLPAFLIAHILNYASWSLYSFLSIVMIITSDR